MIELNIYLMIAAALGSIGYTSYGYFKAKNKDNSIEFDVTYAYAAVTAIIGTALLYSGNVDSINVSDVLQAFLVGFGGNNALTKIKK